MRESAAAKWPVAVTILTASFLQTMASSAASPVLSMIQEEFSGAAMATVQLTMTLPSIFIMLSSVFVTGLLTRFSLKSVTSLGIILYMIGGVGGVAAPSLFILLILRSIMGIGLGLFCPMLPILIAQSFGGQARTDMMGYLQSANFLGGMAGTAAGGILASFGWRNAFWVYLIGLLPLVLSLACVGDKSPADQAREEKKAGGQAPATAWFLGAAMAVHGVLLFKVPLSASTLFGQLGTTNPGRAGMAVAVLYGGSFLAGLLMGKIRRILGRGTFPCACLLLAAAFVLLGASPGESSIFAGSFLLGFGSGVFAPMLYAMVPELVAPLSIPVTMTILNAALYLGMFLSPYVSAAIRMAGGGLSADFYSAVACEIVFAAVAARLAFRKSKATS